MPPEQRVLLMVRLNPRVWHVPFGTFEGIRSTLCCERLDASLQILLAPHGVACEDPFRRRARLASSHGEA
jgi:hypothetical protein